MGGGGSGYEDCINWTDNLADQALQAIRFLDRIDFHITRFQFPLDKDRYWTYRQALHAASADIQVDCYSGAVDAQPSRSAAPDGVAAVSALFLPALLKGAINRHLSITSTPIGITPPLF